MAGLRIRGLEIDPPLFLAPMADLTDPPFRRLVARIGGAGAMVTPMFTPPSARAHQSQRVQVDTGVPGAPPLFVQIAPSSPADVDDSLSRLLSLCSPEGIDINMGCAAPRIRRTGAGAALARDPARAARIVERARVLAGKLPLTVKLRAGDTPVGGLADDSAELAACFDRLADLARRLVDAGADGLVLHPRGSTEGFRRKAAWSLVSSLARSVAVPVIGSGDIDTPAVAVSRLVSSGCAGVMLGRAALGDPWLPAAAAATCRGEPFAPPSLATRGAAVLELADDIAATYDPGRALARIALMSSYALAPFPFGRRVALALRRLPGPAAQRAALAAFLDTAAAGPCCGLTSPQP
ncbi:MAG TPA: tRNA-dihydrouridine synthase family protein [Polyangia bacterium]|nr:tRNA-dihydrouridine synthase family protein [Polyangia bacterium]